MIWELFGALVASRANEERSEAEKAELIRRFFGPRRERFDDDPAQGKLFPTDGLAEADAAKPAPVPVVEAEPHAVPPKKHPHGRRRFPPISPGFAANTRSARWNVCALAAASCGRSSGKRSASSWITFPAITK